MAPNDILRLDFSKMSDSDWPIHPQLAKDTIHLGDLPLARVVIIKDPNDFWLLVPCCG